MNDNLSADFLDFFTSMGVSAIRWQVPVAGSSHTCRSAVVGEPAAAMVRVVCLVLEGQCIDSYVVCLIFHLIFIFEFRQSVRRKSVVTLI